MRTLTVVLLLLVLLAAVAFAAGCNVIRLRHSQLASEFRRFGLSEHEEPLVGANVHYWFGGDADSELPPVVLLHGFGAEGIWQWHRQAQDLSRDRRVLVPNLLWFGRSSDEDPDYRIERQVEVVRALVRHLGLGRVDVVGISYGGLVAYELGSRDSAAVRRVVLLDSPGRVYTDEDYRGLLERFEVQHVGPLMVPEEPEQVQRLIDLAYFKPPRPPRFALRQVLSEHYGETGPHKTALLERVVQDMDRLRRESGDLTAPTLLLWGRQDPVFPLELGERLAAHLGAGCRLEVIEDARHAPNLERWQHVNRSIRGFFDAP